MHSDESVDFFPWLNPSAVDLKTPVVKQESQSDFSSLFSPPSSPFITDSIPSATSSNRRITKSESPRTRPYPELLRGEDTGMSGTSGSGYDNWSRSSRGSIERRSSDGDRPLYQTGTYDSPNPALLSRSSSVSSSSLRGAIASSSSGSQSQYNSPRHGGNMASMAWHQSSIPSEPTTDLSSYADVPYPSTDDSNYGGGYISGTMSSSTNYPYDNTMQTFEFVPTTPNDSPPHFSAIEDLQRKVEELEYRHRRDKELIRSLETQIASLSSNSTTPLPSPSFEASWKARTDARIKQFCSLNRAGNALCAWHDSRRERRIYPPRMAPFGTLNCGCTYEEALFEESLARHRVGLYLPGDSVRMDPALRNPLLKLLQKRYNYRDGDFERDPNSGDWLPGEGPAYWEQQAASGVNPRRQHRDQQHR